MISRRESAVFCSDRYSIIHCSHRSQVQFQHSELLHKREKVFSYQQALQKATLKRQQALDNLRSTLIQRRAQVAAQVPAIQFPTNAADLLLMEVQDDRDGRLAQEWSRLVKVKMDLIRQESRRLEAAISSQERVLQGYRYHLGENDLNHLADVELNNSMMEVETISATAMDTS
jgi:hypothetical protein